ncbi:hypothetical protein JW835_08830 [bacterium]|nr:hypothetical protein [bacterium]
MRHTRQFFWIIGLVIHSSLPGQNFVSTVKGDSVFIFLMQTPAVGQSVVIECKGPQDSDFFQLTQDPIRPVLSLDEARRMLGDDYQEIADALQTENMQQTLYILRNDAFHGGIFTLLNRNVGRVLGRFFVAGGHQKNEIYNYRIRLIDRQGNTQQTFEKRIRIIEKQPVPPADITLAPQPTGMEIAWKYPSWNPDSDERVVQFHLYRRINDSFQLIKDRLLRLDSPEMFYLDRDVKPGVSVCYYLLAVDASGLMSEPSKIVCGRMTDTVPPSQPLGLISRLQEGQVTLIWNLNPELDVASYNVYRAPDMTGPSMKMNTDPIMAEEAWYTDTACKLRTQYFYSVSAVDTAGNESQPSNRISIWIEDKDPPSPPMHLRSYMENHQVQLHWQPSADSDIWGFYVYRGLTDKTLFRLTEKLIQDTLYTDGITNNLEPGTRYYYVVTSVDSSLLESKNAAIWVETPDDQPPQKPGDVHTIVRTGEILIQWNPSTSPDVAIYKLSKICNGTIIELGKFPSSILEWADTTAMKGDTCQYSIIAVDTTGNQSLATLSEKRFMRDYEPPHYPRFLQAKSDKTGVTVQWERTIAEDLAGYILYRAEIETGQYQKISEAPLSALQYHDTEGKPHHWYRVKAFDTSGNESKFSQSAPVIFSNN